MTEPEKKLWQRLRKFDQTVLRPKLLDNYIVDFYCPALKLVIEVDGISHFTKEGKIYDQERTELLNFYGLKVLRFTNEEVMNDFDLVNKKLEEILNH